METTQIDLSIETNQIFLASAVSKLELKEDRNALKSYKRHVVAQKPL